MSSKKLTPKEAAAVIGCSSDHVRNLIRAGKIEASKIKSENNQHGYVWRIEMKEAKRFANEKQSIGWPRGKTRGSKPKKMKGAIGINPE